ncbi:hypothetical protein [Desulforegula conservatrix]|nr:hypothetical protein [Desulforegula conservatrix]
MTENGLFYDLVINEIPENFVTTIKHCQFQQKSDISELCFGWAGFMKK